MNNIKKIDISSDLNIKLGISRSLSGKIINDLIKIFSDQIINDYLIIKNLGRFKLIHKKQRFGRNPRTKEPYLINERKSVSFITSKNLLNKLNNFWSG